MSQKIIEGTLLDENHVYTAIEIREICFIEENILHEMIEFGIIEPIKPSQQLQFSAKTLMRAQKAVRLHRDLEINWAGISLALDLLEEIRELRALLTIQKDSL